MLWHSETVHAVLLWQMSPARSEHAIVALLFSDGMQKLLISIQFSIHKNLLHNIYSSFRIASLLLKALNILEA